MAHEPGAAIGPNLRLVRLLAKGGMGSIWVAEHLALKTPVAVKFIADDAVTDPMITARFEHEAMAVAQLRSPHVVQIFDHGRTDRGTPYMAMELLEGETLGRRLARTGYLNLREAVVIVGQVCRALSKAHAAGIVHRDIKPDNIFLTDSDGELFVKVLDFGIAKREADRPLAMTAAGMAVGTPPYMSPEQSISARDVTFSTDLWAVAAVAYRCLTGQFPFKAETFSALCLALSRGKFTPPSTLRAIPPAFDAWFGRALAVSPADRFPSARELANQFSRAAGFPAGVLISVPSALPGRSALAQSPPARMELGRAAVGPRLSTATVTVLPVPASAFPAPSPEVEPSPVAVARAVIGESDVEADAETLPTGPSISGASINGRFSDTGRSQGNAIAKFVAMVGMSAAMVYVAVFVGRAPEAPGSAAESGGGAELNPAPSGSLPTTPPRSEKRDDGEKIVIDLGFSNSASPAAAASVDPARQVAEISRKQGSGVPLASSAGRAVKAAPKPRARPHPTTLPEKDLMEP